MAHGKDAARDLVHGRRGGNWLPDDYEPTPAPADAPRCSVCGGAMMCGQPGAHWSCCPECEGCHRPLDAAKTNCHCAAKTKKKSR